MAINFELTKTLSTARAGKGGEYFTPGHNYKVVIEKCEWKKARDHVEWVIVETQILESDCPTMGPGRKPSYMINMSIDPGAGNLAEFLRYGLSAFAKQTENVDIDPNDDEHFGEILEDKALLVSILEEEQMLKGTELYLYAKPIKTKKEKDFTLHLWSLTPTTGVVGATAEDNNN